MWYHFIWLLLENKVLRVKKIPISQNPIDMFTKVVIIKEVELYFASVGLKFKDNEESYMNFIVFKVLSQV